MLGFQDECWWTRLAQPGLFAWAAGDPLRLAGNARDPKGTGGREAAACYGALRADTGIEYEGRARGTLQAFRTQKQYDAAAKDIAVLKECGVPYELLDRDGCAVAEPALGLVKEKLEGLYLHTRLRKEIL